MNSSLLSEEEQLALAEVAKENEPSRPAVLIVEDDPDLRSTLAEIFHAHGIRCFTAAGVEPALTVLKNQPSISLLITDLKMACGGGLELVRKVRDSERSALAVIVMSGQAEVEDAIEAMHLNVLEFLLKPVDMKKLIDLVHRELGLNAVSNGGLH